MGKNKLSKFADLESFNHVIQVPVNYLNQNDFEWKGKWNSAFFKNDNPIILELGCGKGEYTVSLAKRFPQINFVGVDIKGARMWKGAKEVIEHNLKNVCFLRTRIEFVHHCFAENEVSEVWLTFPDPQMKKTRRRLTATNFIDNYRKFVVLNGIIHLKTDSNFQFKYTEAMVEENHFDVVKKTDDLYNSELLDDVLSIKTYYEKQWIERGLTIKYLAFRLSHTNVLKEPVIEIEKDPYRSFGRDVTN